MRNSETRNPPDSELTELSGLYDIQDYIGAEKLCRNLLTTYPDSAVVLNIFGVVLEAQGKSKEAQEAYEDTIRRNPDYTVAYNNLGFLLNSLGRLEEAHLLRRALLLGGGQLAVVQVGSVDAADILPLEPAQKVKPGGPVRGKRYV